MRTDLVPSANLICRVVIGFDSSKWTFEGGGGLEDDEAADCDGGEDTMFGVGLKQFMRTTLVKCSLTYDGYQCVPGKEN